MVGQHLMLFENSVESRLGGQINTLVRKLGYDLVGRKIPKRRTIRYIKYLLPFQLAELVRRCCRRTLAVGLDRRVVGANG